MDDPPDPAIGPRVAEAPLPRALALDSADAAAAASAIAAFVEPLEPSLVLLFASPATRLGPVAEALRPRLAAGCALAGCSTAGELVEGGYRKDGVVAIAFPVAGYRVRVVALRDLARNDVTRWMAMLRAGRAALAGEGGRHLLGLVVADGSSRHEDVLAATLDAALEGVQVVGGFGGNGLDFADVVVMEGGAVMRDAAIVCLIATDLPVEEVVFAHFTPTGRRGVVTAADAESHAILELNAEPAAKEYASLAGLDAAHLTPLEFARHPLLLKTGRRHHVRAISGTREDGGLQLLASIDVGTVLTLGRAEDLTEGFAQALARLPRQPALVLGFDCILRRLALEQAGLDEEVAALHRRFNIRGFNTYGELHDGMHVNQTFVGMAFLPPEDAGD